MGNLFSFINKPLGFVLESLAGLFSGNFAAAVFVFTVLINIILIPLSIKSQKSSVQQTRIKPKLDKLRERCGDDKQKYNEEMQKLYQEEKVSMTGGCLPMLLRMVLVLIIYQIIMSPLTYLLHIDQSIIKEASEAIKAAKGYVELPIIEAVKNGTIVSPEISKALETIDFNFFGIDLTQTPKFSLDIFNDAKLIWIMPIIAFASQMLTSFISMRMQKKLNPEAPSMAGMMLTMPLITLFIGFSLPGGVSFYWTCSSLIGGLIQAAIQNFYGPHKMLARERAKELSKQCDFEAGQINKLGANKENNN